MDDAPCCCRVRNDDTLLYPLVESPILRYAAVRPCCAICVMPRPAREDRAQRVGVLMLRIAASSTTEPSRSDGRDGVKRREEKSLVVAARLM